MFYCVNSSDIAYNWNEFWVARSEASSNYSWLYALVITSLFLFAAAISVMGLLFWQFYKPDCTENDAVLILTVLLCTFVTMLQLFVSESGSLLVSAIVTAYCTYLCYSSLSLNPEAACNPTLSTRYQQASQGIGIALTIISLTYTAYSTG